MRLGRMLALAAVLAGTQIALAQAPSHPPAPGPEVKKLGYFVGKWTSEGNAKESPMGPAGKFIGSETDEWFAGGFYVVTHSSVKGPMGAEKELAVMGYDPQEKMYKYTSYSSAGYSESAKGTLESDTWTWTSETNMGGQTYKNRFIVKVLSPESYTFTFEISTDGTQWNSIVEGKAKKVTPAAAKKPAAK